MRAKFLTSLSFKIASILILVVLVFAGCLSGYLYQRELEADIAAAKDRLRSVTNELSMAATHFFKEKDIAGLQELVMALGVKEGIVNAAIIDEGLKVIADTHFEHIGRSTDSSLVVEVFKSAEEQSFLYSKGNREFLRFTSPIFKSLSQVSRKEDIIGAALMEIDITRVKTEARDRFLTLIVGFGLGICLFVIAAYFLLQIMVIKPISILAAATSRLATGDFTVRAPVKSKDEIGELAASFNKMTEDLKKSRQEIEDYSKNLEEKVEERTEELKATNEELESTVEELKQTNEELESTTEELRVANEEAQKAKEQAEKKAEQLEKFNKVAVDRELKMKELKARIAELEGKLKEKG